jgi:single-strand DNA-binding protein
VPTSGTPAAHDEARSSSVILRGRITAEPVERALPSGDAIVTFRMSLPRTATPLSRGSRQRADWVDCAAASARVRRSVTSWAVGDEVEVRGVLRRRFLRGDGAVGSRLEVEALAARRVRTPARADAS